MISGVRTAESGNRIRGKTQIRIISRYNEYRASLPCLIMQNVTSHILNYKLSRSLLQIPSHIRLADTQFDVPYDVDMIIGNGYFWDIMSVGQHRLGPGLSVLLKTQMGWVHGGCVRSTTASQPRICNVITNKPWNNQLTRFWEIETILESNESNHWDDLLISTNSMEEAGTIKCNIEELRINGPRMNPQWFNITQVGLRPSIVSQI